MKQGLTSNGAQKRFPDGEIVRYRCACSEVVVQTSQAVMITPERIEETKCPKCHVRYRAITKSAVRG